MDRHRKKNCYKDAVDICETIAVDATEVCLPAIGQQVIAKININQRRLDLAHQSEKTLAFGVLLRRHRDLMTILRSEANDIHSLCCEIEANRLRVTPGEIYCDLESLQREFDDVKYCRKEKLLSVTTEPIELEEIYLGPFRIVLDCTSLSQVTTILIR